MSESGKPRAVNVTAAQIAPEAPREGNMSITGRLRPVLVAVLVAAEAAVTAAVVAFDAALDNDIWDISRGNMIRVDAI